MKLRTLFAALALLCIALLAISCGEGAISGTTDTTEAVPTHESTTTANRPKYTTTQPYHQCTIRIETTTLPPDLYTKIPSALHGNEAYVISDRIGFESEDDILMLLGTGYSNPVWTDNGICGVAFSFACPTAEGDNATPKRAECEIELIDPIPIENQNGILWYVDFSALSKNPEQTNSGDGVCVSVALNWRDKAYRSECVNGDEFSGRGYYFKDGKWVETRAVNECMLSVPDKFVGWIYVPFSSYKSLKEEHDVISKQGYAIYITSVKLYTDGYVYTDAASVIFDEILFVK